MGIVARQSIKGSLANYLGVAIGFVTTFFVLTNYLSTEEIGLTRVLVDAATLFAAFAQMGSMSSIIKYFPYFDDGRRNNGMFGMSLLLPFVGFVLVVAFLLVFRGQIIDIYSERSPLVGRYFYILLPLTLFVLYLTVFETNANVLMRISVPRFIREVGIRVMTLVCYLLYGYRVISFDVFVLLFSLSYGVAMLLNLLYLIKLKRISFRFDFKAADRSLMSGFLRYSIFMTLIVLAGNSQLMGSLFVGAKEGLAMTGVYTIAFFIANVVEVPFRSLGAISRPVVAAAAKDGDWHKVSNIAKNVSLHQLLTSSVILLLIWVNLDALFAVIPNGSEYKGGKWVVLLLGLAKVVNSTLSIGIDTLNYSRFYRAGLPFVLMLSIGMLLLNYWLVDAWSINGAAASTLFAYIAYYIVLLAYNRAKLGVSLFSPSELKVLAVIAMGVAVDVLWRLLLAPLFADSLVWILVEAVLKTSLISLLMATATYKMKISPHVNGLFDKLLHWPPTK